MNKPFYKQLFFALIILAVLSSCSGTPTAPLPITAPILSTASPAAVIPTTGPSPSANQPSPGYWPSPDWRTSSPEQQGMDSTVLSKMIDVIQGNENFNSVVVVRNGYIVTEAYYSPFRADASHNIVTVTETVVSILTGIAIQQGYLKSVDQKMLDFFPDRKIDNLDARKQAITIRDLLSMTSGFLGDDDGLATSDDWVQYQLNLSMDKDPGTTWNASRGGYILLTAIIQKATGMTALAFANKFLFGPLGISDAVWETDSQGIENGGNRMYLNSRDLAKIGYLYLKNGEWNGKQIVSKDYVSTSTKHQFDISTSPGWGYGYGWWTAADGSYSSEVEPGQLISVMPEQGIVAIFTGGTAENITADEADILNKIIVPAIKSGGSLPENPTSIALLNDKITALEKPAPNPIPPLPEIARTISGKKYLLKDGETFTLTFNGDQATLDWSLKDQSMQLQIGMDNVFRTTPTNQTERLSPFGANPKTVNPGFIALQGSWKTDRSEFDLTMQLLNSTRRHRMAFSFAGDKVNVIQTNVDGGEPTTVYFQGQVQGPSSITTTPTP